jgi:hypothetical protein
MQSLLALKETTADVAAALAQLGARTGDPARDVAESFASTVAEHLAAAGWTEAAEKLLTVTDTSSGEAGRIFGEALPEGLMLAPSR